MTDEDKKIESVEVVWLHDKFPKEFMDWFEDEIQIAFGLDDKELEEEEK